MITTSRQRPALRRHSVLAWVPVTDAHGRTRMEMRWHVRASGRAVPPRSAAA